MNYIRILLLLLLIPIQTAWSKDYVVKLGQDRVLVKEYPGKGKTYVHVHRNETTALKAAKAVIKSRGGTLITLEHKGGRNVSFRLKGKKYTFDPNRIFTEKGIQKTLKKNGPYSKAAAKEVKKLARMIKILLPTSGKIIAVHNNKDFSLKNYMKGKDMAKDAAKLYYNPKKYYRNFFLVTRKKDFDRLKRAGWNAVLQAKHATDDGSLSVYLAKKQYINIEAGYDQLKQQIEMLRKV